MMQVIQMNGRPTLAHCKFVSRALLVFLALVFFAPLVSAKKSGFDQDLLRPADTSSPRGTLTSFLSDSNRFIKDSRQDKVGEKSYRAFRRASQTLDFSTTSEGDSWLVRIRRMALLHELLARIELPPLNSIPGDREIADGSVTSWTIPNTAISIIRIESGPRASQFLFSADTVQALDRLYRQARHMPYKPGSTAGIYEEMISADTRTHSRELELRNRLKPVDTSSPRSTFEGFLDNVNRAYQLVSKANLALQADQAAVTREEARIIEGEASNLLQRASDTLDLSQVPEALRRDVSIEMTLQLKEVFDRMLLPPIDAMPTVQVVEAERRAASELTSQSTLPFRWKLPSTTIEIVEIRDGERQGEFLFSTGTIRRIGETYNKVKDLPYRQAQFGGTELEYLSPGLSPGFYEDYVSSSGYLIPQIHFLGRLIDDLPESFKAVIGNQMVWQWFGLLLFVLLTAFAAYTAYRYIDSVAKQKSPPSADWLKVLAVAIVLLIVIAVDLFINQVLKFTSNLQAVVTTSTATAVFLLAAWVVFLSSKAIAETVIATPRMRRKSSEATLLRIGARVVGFLMAVWIVVDGIRSLGADLIPLLAGLGIGGLAVALAAQTTIANFIGGLILLANKPVQAGDFCRYGEDPSADWQRIGTVEEINWISTRIRGLDRTVTTIPNAEFANLHIVNLTKRDQRLMRATLQLRYETTADQMRYILVNLRKLLLGHPKVSPNPARVRFVSYGDYSKDVEIFCYLRCQEHNEFLAIQEDLLLRMGEIVTEAGSGFAFPSQTAYLARDEGLDEKRSEQAEREVEQLRATGNLPFPEFDEEQRGNLEDLLDYPPTGSPEIQARADSSVLKRRK